ncbi:MULTISPECIES: TetR/AcrR family transcriptional regulator [Bradyrhizobium]|jgi:AcrR family transcriptional regulator|uniref:TetR/AcrR family transcriptional regulator n=1 Tax=Bradyrhizobium TaxID=374 RepID=UPI0004137B80|nr:MULTISPECIES: TetR/AcrR family transcriptional regulator [Bradyrhizobium]KIU52458.1 transcriptional regulator [Bradyrhizobium elkanii]MBK5650270.1 TetR/AcrR family transcriptional regulator [Rhizobium sp.]OCX29478.1 transcriptional regulator [Bradyrhizobium sp. UASWS1016]
MSIEERSSKGARRFQRRARQEADKEALKALILETARKEFAAGTLETVSIQKIADAIGYSKGTVLKYYPTKLLLLLAVKQQNLEAVAGQLERVRAQTADSDLRLRQVMETYLDYWADNPDHFRSLFSMSGTIEDRRFPDGVYFGETEIARRSYELFVISVREYLAARGAEPAPGLPQRLASALLAATHGVVALTLGTPTMKLPDMRATGRLLIASLIDAWTSKLAAARTSEGWPRITISTFA